MKMRFPHIYPIAKSSLKALEDYVKHIIGVRGRITYRDVSLVAETTIGEWTGRIYHEFVEQFLIQQKKILTCFNVTGKFVYSKDSQGYEYIKYEGVKQK